MTASPFNTPGPMILPSILSAAGLEWVGRHGWTGVAGGGAAAGGRRRWTCRRWSPPWPSTTAADGSPGWVRTPIGAVGGTNASGWRTA